MATALESTPPVGPSILPVDQAKVREVLGYEVAQPANGGKKVYGLERKKPNKAGKIASGKREATQGHGRRQRGGCGGPNRTHKCSTQTCTKLRESEGVWSTKQKQKRKEITIQDLRCEKDSGGGTTRKCLEIDMDVVCGNRTPPKG